MSEEPMIYRDITEQSPPGAGARYLYGRRVGAGQIVKIQTTVAVNQTSATGTRITIGIEDKDDHRPIKSWAGATAAKLTSSTDLVYYLREGERPYVYFEDATAGDELLLMAYGEYLLQPLGEEEEPQKWKVPDRAITS